MFQILDAISVADYCPLASLVLTAHTWRIGMNFPDTAFIASCPTTPPRNAHTGPAI
jgi:hypothetical protein